MREENIPVERIMVNMGRPARGSSNYSCFLVKGSVDSGLAVVGECCKMEALFFEKEVFVLRGVIACPGWSGEE